MVGVVGVASVGGGSLRAIIYSVARARCGCKNAHLSRRVCGVVALRVDAMHTLSMTTTQTATATETATATVWAVTCPGDPHEDRPTHFVTTDAETAIGRYAGVYRGETRADEVDLEKLADEADEAGDDAQARDCRLAIEGDQAAMRRVCVALG